MLYSVGVRCVRCVSDESLQQRASGTGPVEVFKIDSRLLFGVLEFCLERLS